MLRPCRFPRFGTSTIVQVHSFIKMCSCSMPPSALDARAQKRNHTVLTWSVKTSAVWGCGFGVLRLSTLVLLFLESVFSASGIQPWAYVAESRNSQPLPETATYSLALNSCNPSFGGSGAKAAIKMLQSGGLAQSTWVVPSSSLN